MDDNNNIIGSNNQYYLSDPYKKFFIDNKDKLDNLNLSQTYYDSVSKLINGQNSIQAIFEDQTSLLNKKEENSDGMSKRILSHYLGISSAISLCIGAAVFWGLGSLLCGGYPITFWNLETLWFVGGLGAGSFLSSTTLLTRGTTKKYRTKLKEYKESLKTRKQELINEYEKEISDLKEETTDKIEKHNKSLRSKKKEIVENLKKEEEKIKSEYEGQKEKATKKDERTALKQNYERAIAKAKAKSSIESLEKNHNKALNELSLDCETKVSSLRTKLEQDLSRIKKLELKKSIPFGTRKITSKILDNINEMHSKLSIKGLSDSLESKKLKISEQYHFLPRKKRKEFLRFVQSVIDNKTVLDSIINQVEKPTNAQNIIEDPLKNITLTQSDAGITVTFTTPMNNNVKKP